MRRISLFLSQPPPAMRLLTRTFRPAARIGARPFSTDHLKRTATYEDHVALGGKLVDFAGYAMPVQYVAKDSKHSLSIIESTKWTREHASLFDVSHMCSVIWRGKDAVRFVEKVTVADVAGLPVGRGVLSVICNEAGGSIDDTMITKCADEDGKGGEHIYQVINAGCADKDLAHFRKHLAEFDGEVDLEVHWDTRGLFALQGPESQKILEKLSGKDLSQVAFGEWIPALDLGGAKTMVSRCGYTGEDGFELFVPGDAIKDTWKLLLGQDGVRAAGLGARDALRLEAGLCLYGHELDEETTPVEAGLAWTVGKARRDPSNAPFLGKEKIVGQINDAKTRHKYRVGMFTKGPPAREGAKILSADGQEVGVVTSGSMSPCLGRNISIGYVGKGFQKAGTPLQVVVRNKTHTAEVTKMPFVPTKYYKP
mmetsp:Transcript_47205/g.106963  ORF Transcript_47205/g.106963 Transcript_47205/m.106963 type:complete len:424 (+) Transcript_47205:20-1291(+)